MIWSWLQAGVVKFVSGMVSCEDEGKEGSGWEDAVLVLAGARTWDCDCDCELECEDDAVSNVVVGCTGEGNTESWGRDGS